MVTGLRNMWLGLVLLSLLSVFSSVRAEEPVRLVTGEYPPYTGASLPDGGYVSLLVQEVFHRAGLEVTIEFLPWKRGYLLMKRGQYDGTFPYLLNEERAPDVHSGDPLVLWESRVYWHADSKRPLTSLAELRGLHECLPLGYAAIDPIEKLHQQGEILRSSPTKARSCWLMLANGRADFMVEDTLVADIARASYLAENKNKVTVSQKLVSFDAGYLIFSRLSPRGEKLRDLFDQALIAMRDEGRILTLRNQYIAQLSR